MLSASPTLRAVLDTAMRRQRADMARVARALHALAQNDTDVSLALFTAIATAYRNALASAKKLQTLGDEHKALAVVVFATQATALEAWYRSLRPDASAQDRRRDETRAQWHFRGAARALLQLDRVLGCPYGCKEPKK
jgi:hypothetical protein